LGVGLGELLDLHRALTRVIAATDRLPARPTSPGGG
jgi:hypothetical protein